MQNKNLHEILCSKLCHDLITPSGAMVTGMELLRDINHQDPEYKDILELLDRSSKNMASKLTAFRMALGSGGWNAGIADAKKIADDYYSDSKLELKWIGIDSLLEPGSGWGKVLINLLMILQDSAPRGGILEVTLPSSQNTSLDLSINAEQIKISDELLEVLQTPDIALASTKNIQALFLQNTIKDMGLKLDFYQNLPQNIKITISED